MARLKLAGVMVALSIFASPAAAQPGRWEHHIAEASDRFGIPADWIRRVIGAESGGRTHQNGHLIVSRAGAMGLMQLMPRTWHEMRIAHRLGDDPFNSRDNILAGAAYLRAMHDRFGHPGLFAAYNAGPARYADHLATGRALPAETRSYVWRLSRMTYFGDNQDRPALRAEPIFAIGGSKDPGRARQHSPGSPLFVRRDLSASGASD